MALRAAPRAAAATMVLTRLALTDFRSYAAAELTPDPGSPWSPARTAPARRTCSRRSTPRSSADRTAPSSTPSSCATGRRSRACGWSWRRHGRRRRDDRAGRARRGADPGMRKRLTVNGVPRRSSTLSEVARVVLFRPEEMLLLVGSPVGSPPIPGRHRGAARPARGPRPGRGGARHRPAQRAPARDPGRGGAARRARLLGRAARAGRRAGHAGAARGAGRARRAHRPAARRGRHRGEGAARSG